MPVEGYIVVISDNIYDLSFAIGQYTIINVKGVGHTIENFTIAILCRFYGIARNYYVVICTCFMMALIPL